MLDDEASSPRALIADMVIPPDGGFDQYLYIWAYRDDILLKYLSEIIPRFDAHDPKRASLR